MVERLGPCLCGLSESRLRAKEFLIRKKRLEEEREAARQRERQEAEARRAGRMSAQEQYEEGMAYWSGKNRPIDVKQAAALFHQAADRSHAAAQYMLGFCYFIGRGVEEDRAQAMLWFSRSADLGYQPAKRALLFR